MTDSRHILIVDDDREIRTLLGDYLQKNGYRTTAVADGKAMRRALDQSHVDLIVLDLMLPGEDGLKLTRELRAHSQIPILMLTAFGEEIDRVVGLGSRRRRLPVQAVQSPRAGGKNQSDPATDRPHAARSHPERRERVSLRRLATRCNRPLSRPIPTALNIRSAAPSSACSPSCWRIRPECCRARS